MFEATKAMFIYTTSPLHVGAGTSLGAVDNPIQREAHTGHPMVPGSALKGALRHEAWHLEREGKVQKDDVVGVFGPETGSADDTRFSGAVAFSDARLVLFPVRSATRGFVYAASPLTLGVLHRTLVRAGAPVAWEPPPADADGGDQDRFACGASWDGDGDVVLELYQFDRNPASCERAKAVAEWLAEQALPQMGSAYFVDHLRNNLVILPEEAFCFFVRNATMVEPHVRIDDETGAADNRGLFYTESLPPESLLVSLVAASRTRGGNGEKTAPEVLAWLAGESGLGVEGRPLQLGGDATTGRGQVAVRFTGGESQ